MPPDDTVLMNLAERPRIHQAGLGEHGLKREEEFVRPRLWALHLYLWSGSLSFRGSHFPIEPNTLSLTPPDTLLRWHFPLEPCRHFFVHFTLGKGAPSPLPIISRATENLSDPGGKLRTLVECASTHPLRAEVILWDLLLQMADANRPAPQRQSYRPGPIETALGIISNEMGSGINAAGVATRVGLSYSQLNRLFKEHIGASLAAHIAAQRMLQASRLLTTTDLKIKAIAALVGIPDLQHFNKFVKRHTGQTPTALRSS